MGWGTIDRFGVARIPPDTEIDLFAKTASTIVVVSAAVEDVPSSGVSVLDLDECEFSTPETSAIVTTRLTRPLGCLGMKVNARVLQPNQHVPMHTEGEQEELFIPIRGPATMRFEGVDRITPVGTVTRVSPEIPRSARNDGDVESLWVMIGAPPTGAPDEWDPGSEIIE